VAIVIFSFLFTLILIVGLATLLDYPLLRLNPSPPSPETVVKSPTAGLAEGPTLTPSPSHTPSSTPLPSATPTPTVTPTPTLVPEVARVLEEGSFADYVGQLLMIGISGTEMTSRTCNLIHEIKPGGLILTGSNALNPQQLKSFTMALKGCAQEAGVDGGMIIAMDHEGQYVYRYDSGATRFAMPMALGAIGDVQLAYEVAQASGRELLFSGVNTVLGPVADVLTNSGNAVISTRSFGSDPEEVSALVSNTAAGYSDLGLLPVIKHFPGLGSVATDPHLELPVDESSRERIENVHLQPFQRGIGDGIPIVMVSHVDYPALDSSGLPSSMSSSIVQDLLKEEMGFEGVVLTDAIEMGAVVHGAGMMVDEATVTAIGAGVDMVMVVSPSNARFAYRALRDAVQGGDIPAGRLADALRRILTLKYRFHLEETIPVAEVDWSENTALSEEVGRASVALEKDVDDFIPLPSEWGRLLVVCPYWYLSIPTAIESGGWTLDHVGYSLPLGEPVPEGAALESLPKRAVGYDAVVVCTYDAYLTRARYEDPSQLNMVRGFLESGVPTIVIALKSPYDLLGFPGVRTYLSTFGTTPGQLSMAADVLLGKAEAMGEVPVVLEE
jgi:beta-N-acetylhexosaminidase